MTGEAIRKVNLNARRLNFGQEKRWFPSPLRYKCSGPATAPNSKSATDRFIMRYYCACVDGGFLAVIVMALIIDITRNLVLKAGNLLVSCFAGESSVAICVNEI